MDKPLAPLRPLCQRQQRRLVGAARSLLEAPHDMIQRELHFGQPAAALDGIPIPYLPTPCRLHRSYLHTTPRQLPTQLPTSHRARPAACLKPAPLKAWTAALTNTPNHPTWPPNFACGLSHLSHDALAWVCAVKSCTQESCHHCPAPGRQNGGSGVPGDLRCIAIWAVAYFYRAHLCYT